MNRRTFLSAIPAALVGAKTVAQPTTVVVSAHAHAANTYITPAYASGVTFYRSPWPWERAETGEWWASGTRAYPMSPGRLYCEHCDAGAFPNGPRISENHLAVRFGHSPHYRVLLDAEDVSDRCIEAMAGPDGWAILETMPTDGSNGYESACPVCLGNTFVVKRGYVIAGHKDDLDSLLIALASVDA